MCLQPSGSSSLPVLICISLMTDNIEHLVMGCWPHIPSLEKGLFESFPQSFNWFICLLIIQLISLIVINLRFIRDVACTERCFFFSVWIVFHCIVGHNLCICSPVDGHLSCFDFWWIWIKLLEIFRTGLCADVCIHFSRVNTQEGCVFRSGCRTVHSRPQRWPLHVHARTRWHPFQRRGSLLQVCSGIRLQLG